MRLRFRRITPAARLTSRKQRDWFQHRQSGPSCEVIKTDQRMMIMPISRTDASLAGRSSAARPVPPSPCGRRIFEDFRCARLFRRFLPRGKTTTRTRAARATP
ncbi:hypothetical protein MTO96_018448 [Rhipicephalus appendiculatus]